MNSVLFDGKKIEYTISQMGNLGFGVMTKYKFKSLEEQNRFIDAIKKTDKYYKQNSSNGQKV